MWQVRYKSLCCVFILCNFYGRDVFKYVQGVLKRDGCVQYIINWPYDKLAFICCNCSVNKSN